MHMVHIAPANALTLLPLMLLLLTCRDQAEDDQIAPPSPPSAVLLVKVQFWNWHRAVVHATAPPNPWPYDTRPHVERRSFLGVYWAQMSGAGLLQLPSCSTQ